MSRTSLFCAAALIASALATPGFAAAVDVSSALPAQPITTSSGATVDVFPIVDAAGQVANAGIALATPAQSASQNADETGSPLAGLTPVGAGGLTDARGGTNVTFDGAITNQDLSAVNTGNAINATQVTNGAVSVGPNAFSGFNGVGNFLMNTGNQNNIQGSLSINVVIPNAPTGH
jgi:hypothetical protein